MAVYIITGLKQGWYCGFPGLMTVLYADVERMWKKPKMVSKNNSTVMILVI
jgi:hypothetical protein